ncbi:uncharacterized protein ACOB8E_003663 [Sarcophilus harrisii]
MLGASPSPKSQLRNTPGILQEPRILPSRDPSKGGCWAGPAVQGRCPSGFWGTNWESWPFAEPGPSPRLPVPVPQFRQGRRWECPRAPEPAGATPSQEGPYKGPKEYHGARTWHARGFCIGGGTLGIRTVLRGPLRSILPAPCLPTVSICLLLAQNRIPGPSALVPDSPVTCPGPALTQRGRRRGPPCSCPGSSCPRHPRRGHVSAGRQTSRLFITGGAGILHHLQSGGGWGLQCPLLGPRGRQGRAEGSKKAAGAEWGKERGQEVLLGKASSRSGRGLGKPPQQNPFTSWTRPRPSSGVRPLLPGQPPACSEVPLSTIASKSLLGELGGLAGPQITRHQGN